MKSVVKIFTAFFFLVILLNSSCKKKEEVIEGCTDNNAMNYMLSATHNDGSCVYAYDIVQGEWNVFSSCEAIQVNILVTDIDIPITDLFPEDVTINGNGSNVISIQINESIVLANITSDGLVTIQNNQTIPFNTGIPLVGDFDVIITGSGSFETVSNGSLLVNLSFDIPLAGSQNSSCNIVFTR